MKRLLSLLVSLALIISMLSCMGFIVSAQTAGAALWVDPITGSDANSGTESAPFKTIEYAKSVAAELSSTQDVTVYLNGGTYTLTETVEFTGTDAGQNGNTITFTAVDGEEPVISGGTEITGWTLHDAETNIYKATVPADAAGARQFYIDGVSQTRAMTEVSPTDWTILSSCGYMSPYSTTRNTNEYIIIDLGESHPVSLVTLYPNDELDTAGKAAGFPTDFTIETSTDGVDYTVQLTETDFSAPSVNSKVDLTFNAVSARYIKLNVTKLGTADRLNPGRYMLSLSEITVGQAATEVTASALDFTKVQHIDFSNNLVTADRVSFFGYYDSRDEADHSYITDGIPISNIADGSTGNFISTGGYQSSWLSGANGPMTPKLEVNLGGTVTISSIQLAIRLENGSPVNQPVSFDIDVMNKSGTWVNVVTERDYEWTNSSALFSFNPLAAQSIRIKVYELGTSDSASAASGSIYFQLTELSVYKPADIAVGATVIAPNSWEYETMSRDNLTSGVVGAMYTSNSSTDPRAVNAPVTIDLGSVQSVGGVRLYPRDTTYINYPTALEIAISTDGVNYETLMALEDIPLPTGEAQFFTFNNPVNARYVRITPTEIGNGEDVSGTTAYRFQLVALEIAPAKVDGANNPIPDGLVSHSGAKQVSTLYPIETISALHNGINNNNYVSRAIDGIIYADETNLGYVIPATYDLDDFINPTDIEINIIHWWCHSIIKTAGISADGTELYFDRTNLPWYGMENDRPTWIENAYELIDEVGEWYIDQNTNTIYYKADDAMTGKTAFLPVCEQLLTFDNCQNISFDGIKFMYTTWTEPNDNGMDDAQAGTYYVAGEGQKEVPGGIEIGDSINISIVNSEILNFGGGGIRIWNGCEDIEISGNCIHDISSVGIWIGSINGHGTTCTSGTDVKNTVVRNNYITRVGVDYYDSPAITSIYTEGTVIDHNEISNCPYTGISLGWGWDFVDVACSKDNVISNNYIHNVGLTQHDGGSIYTLGYQPGTMIYGNYMHDYHIGDYDKDAALYLDEGSEGIEVYNNVVGTGVYQWLKMWTSSICNNHWHDNFYAVNRANNSGTNNVVENNTYVADADFSSYAAAQTIINNAGLTDDGVKAGITNGAVTQHTISFTQYADSDAYYFTTINGLVSFTIPSQLGGTQYNWEDHEITIIMPAGTSLTSLSPAYVAESGFTCNKLSGAAQDFSLPVEYIFTDGTYSITWTVSVFEEVTTTGDPTGTVVTLNSAIDNASEWTKTPTTNSDGSITFSTTNSFSGYIGTRFTTDNILEFDMSAELYADQDDWVGFALRSQDPYESLDTMYYIGFKNDSIEVQKWVDGQRTMLYGTITGYTPIYGNIDNTYFESNTRHSIKTGAVDVPGGVRLFMYIDGVKVFDIVDMSDPIATDGFFVVYPMTHAVTLYDFSDIEASAQ